MFVWRVRDSENVDTNGISGKGFSFESGGFDSSGVRGIRISGGGVFLCLTTRFRSLEREDGGVSDSSPEHDGVQGGVGGRDGDSLIFTWRSSETDIVASAAISRARDDDRGVVVNTTKYGMEVAREKVTGLGRVI